jgi:hypothetical protein
MVRSLSLPSLIVGLCDRPFDSILTHVKMIGSIGRLSDHNVFLFPL